MTMSPSKVFAKAEPNTLVERRTHTHTNIKLICPSISVWTPVELAS